MSGGSLMSLCISPLLALSFLKGIVKRLVGPPPRLMRHPSRKQGCLLESHPLAFYELPSPEAQWVEPKVTSQGHSCSLCGPWEHAQAQRALLGPRGALPATFVSTA